MIRDYAKRNTNKNKKKSSHLSLWIVVIFLFTMFTLSLVFFGKHKLKNSTSTALSSRGEVRGIQENLNLAIKPEKSDSIKGKQLQKIKQKSKNVSKITEETKIVTEEVPPPKFDFYTILPEKNDNKLMTGYEIEITVTKDSVIAENLKTQLGLLGLVAQVTTIQKTSGQPKYRVSIGPYDSKPAATTDLAKIQQGKIHGKIKKVY